MQYEPGPGASFGWERDEACPSRVCDQTNVFRYLGVLFCSAQVIQPGGPCAGACSGSNRDVCLERLLPVHRCVPDGSRLLHAVRPRPTASSAQAAAAPRSHIPGTQRGIRPRTALKKAKPATAPPT